jgi:hypothetical protein
VLLSSQLSLAQNKHQWLNIKNQTQNNINKQQETASEMGLSSGSTDRKGALRCFKIDYVLYRLYFEN